MRITGSRLFCPRPTPYPWWDAHFASLKAGSGPAPFKVPAGLRVYSCLILPDTQQRGVGRGTSPQFDTELVTGLTTYALQDILHRIVSLLSI